MEAEIRQKRKNKPYTISKVDGKEIWYVHKTGFPNVPVFVVLELKQKHKRFAECITKV